MIRRLKKSFYKISIKSVLGCLIVITIVFTNNIITKGAEIYISDYHNPITYSSEYKFIIDSSIKFYDDINKVQKIMSYKFKVPSYLPMGSTINDFEIRKISDKDSVLGISFNNPDGNFLIQILQEDPENLLEEIEREKAKGISNSQVECEKYPMKLGDVEGLKILLTTTFNSGEVENNPLNKKNSSYFVWENEGVWYALEYDSSSKSKENTHQFVKLTEDAIVKIAKSLEYPEKITEINYTVKRENSNEYQRINIYDNDDLESVKSLLGFNPKFPLKINNDINIKNSIVSIAANLDEKDSSDYELSNFYSNKKGSIIFTQKNKSDIYDKIKEYGYFTEDGDTLTTIKADKLNVDNREVFRYANNGIVSEITYLWKENDVYYSVIFFIDTENLDEIVKDFVDSNSIS